MSRTNLLVFVLAASLRAMVPLLAEETPSLFSGIEKGSRVEVHLKRGAALHGEVRWIWQNSIWLDLSGEDTLLEGQIRLASKEILRIRLLPGLNEQQKLKAIEKRMLFRVEAARLEEETRKEAENLEKLEGPSEEIPEANFLPLLLKKFPPQDGWGQDKYRRLSAEPIPSLSELDRQFVQQFELWKKAYEASQKTDRFSLLLKFPPDQGWSAERYQEFSTQFIRTGAALTDEEAEFVRRFTDWQLAQEELAKEQEAEKEKSPPSAQK